MRTNAAGWVGVGLAAVSGVLVASWARGDDPEPGASAPASAGEAGGAADAGVAQENSAKGKSAAWWAGRLDELGDAGDKGKATWAPRLETLFAGIDLTSEQQREVDAILGKMLRERALWQEMREERKRAAGQGDRARAQELAGQIAELRASLRPEKRMAELREVLSDEQKPTYDMNRAKLFEAVRQRMEAGRGPQPLPETRQRPAPRRRAPPPDSNARM